jgi:hypothetical protein
MSGPSTRDFAVIIDRAVESKPNEITVEGAIEGQRVKVVLRMEERPKRVMGHEPWRHQPHCRRPGEPRRNGHALVS